MDAHLIQMLQRIFLRHNVLNHSVNFVNENGIHTNNIEGFWSILKYELRKQHGLREMKIMIR